MKQFCQQCSLIRGYLTLDWAYHTSKHTIITVTEEEFKTRNELMRRSNER